MNLFRYFTFSSPRLLQSYKAHALPTTRPVSGASCWAFDFRREVGIRSVPLCHGLKLNLQQHALLTNGKGNKRTTLGGRMFPASNGNRTHRRHTPRLIGGELGLSSSALHFASVGAPPTTRAESTLYTSQSQRRSGVRSIGGANGTSAPHTVRADGKLVDRDLPTVVQQRKRREMGGLRLWRTGETAFSDAHVKSFYRKIHPEVLRKQSPDEKTNGRESKFTDAKKHVGRNRKIRAARWTI